MAREDLAGSSFFAGVSPGAENRSSTAFTRRIATKGLFCLPLPA
jgi:hypothetical protein